LNQEQKTYNHKLSSERIFCRECYSQSKNLSYLGEGYRNRRRRFGLRFNLIAAIYNFELAIKN
jgi:hypothetical protein